MLHIVTWLWGTKWPAIYAERLFAGVRRNLAQPFNLILMSDRLERNGADAVHLIDEADAPYVALPGCLARMRMFDKGWQDRIGAVKGDLIVNMDIDCIITDKIDHLFDVRNEFTIMQGYNTTNPCPFNGSLWTFRARERHDVWNDFSIEAHSKFNVPIHSIADDQGWLHHKFPKASAYTSQDGVYCLKKRMWPGSRKRLPQDACLVAFPGRDPGKYQEIGWVKENWIC